MGSPSPPREDDVAQSGQALTIEAAERLIAERPCGVGAVEDVPLGEADGRILASDIVAPIPLPPFDNSAVDGYAFRHADLAVAGAGSLPLAARIPAGTGDIGDLPRGVAARIFTGAPMPRGFDTVAMQERARVAGEAVLLPADLAPGANRRRAGEDVAQGATALVAGTRLDPRSLALAAALGLPALSVRTRLRVALFSTGDEVREPGDDVRYGEIHDANRPMLAALLRRTGAAVSDLGILRDAPARLPEALREAAGHVDLIVTSGGVSVGEEDHLRAAVIAAGGSLVFWRLAVKPGRPVALGTIGSATLAALPGNPIAAFVTFVRLVRPLVARLTGERFVPAPPLLVRAAFHHAKASGPREYLRARVEVGEDGLPRALRHPGKGAASLSSLVGSDGLVEVMEETTAVAPGDLIRFLPYDGLV